MISIYTLKATAEYVKKVLYHGMNTISSPTFEHWSNVFEIFVLELLRCHRKLTRMLFDQRQTQNVKFEVLLISYRIIGELNNKMPPCSKFRAEMCDPPPPLTINVTELIISRHKFYWYRYLSEILNSTLLRDRTESVAGNKKGNIIN